MSSKRRLVGWLGMAVLGTVVRGSLSAPVPKGAHTAAKSSPVPRAGEWRGSASSPSLVVRGGTLIDGTGKAAVPNACVVVTNGRIAGAGPLGRVSVPAGARTFAAPRGMTLLPGYIDMHVHSTVKPGLMPYWLACGVTSVRDLGCAQERLEELKRYRSDVAAGKEVGPRMFLAGPPLDGYPRAATWFPGPGARTEAEAEAGVRQLADAGADVIKLYRRLKIGPARAAVAEAHRRGLPVTWDYQWNYRYLADAAQTGVDGLEHVYYSERSSAIDYQQLAELIGAPRLWFDPTLVAFRPPDDSVTRDPDYTQLPRSLTGFWHKLFWPMETDAEFVTMKSFVRLVHRQGGRILIGTDCPVKWVAPGYGFHREVELLRECDLTPMELIRAATQQAAESLHHEKELGTVEPGKMADLVLVSGDPLKDVRVMRNVQWVMQGGKVYAPKELVRKALASAPATSPALPPYLHGD